MNPATRAAQEARYSIVSASAKRTVANGNVEKNDADDIFNFLSICSAI